jgi:hypothetical protein
MGDEFTGDIVRNATKCRALGSALDAEARARAKLWDRGDDEMRNAPSQITLQRDPFLSLWVLGFFAIYVSHGSDPFMSMPAVRTVAAARHNVMVTCFPPMSRKQKMVSIVSIGELDEVSGGMSPLTLAIGLVIAGLLCSF